MDFKTNSNQKFETILTSQNKSSFGLHTAVHFITCIFTVDHLITATEVGDAASIFALELPWFAQGHCKDNFE